MVPSEIREVVGVIHVARPTILLVRNLPVHCEPSVIFIFPAISSLALGVFVPIHTFPVASTLIRWLPSPSAKMMVLERSLASPVTLAPMMVLADPVMIPQAVLAPMAVLLSPLTLDARVAIPYAVLFLPEVLETRASIPLAVLLSPVTLE